MVTTGTIRATTPPNVTWGRDGQSFATDWASRGDGPRDGGYNDSAAVNITNTQILIAPFVKGGQVHAGAATTSGRFSMGAGSVSARIRVCLNAPLRTAIWLQSPDNRAKNGRIGQGREIDIAEIYTSPTTSLRGYVAENIHYGGYAKYHVSVSGPRVPINPCQFHTYRVEFGNAGYTFYIDAKRKWSVKSPFHGDDEYLLFSVEVPEYTSKQNYVHDLGYAELEQVSVRANGT